MVGFLYTGRTSKSFEPVILAGKIHSSVCAVQVDGTSKTPTAGRLTTECAGSRPADGQWMVASFAISPEKAHLLSPKYTTCVPEFFTITWRQFSLDLSLSERNSEIAQVCLGYLLLIP